MPTAESPSGPPAPANWTEIERLLREVAAGTKRDQRRGRIQLTLAIMLSLATLSSTWCGYQAGRWGSASSSSQALADTNEREAAENTILGLQLRTQDGVQVLEFWRALRTKDTASQELIRQHMHPRLQAAVQASLDAGIVNNPGVPGPLHQPAYIIAEEQQAQTQRAEAKRLNAEAGVASRVASEYVLLTLMFASVLFFGGIVGTFGSHRVRVGLACVALAIFAFAIIMLLGLPTKLG